MPPHSGEELGGLYLTDVVKRFHMLEQILDDSIAAKLTKDRGLICIKPQW
jgi:hypothetical protein